MILIDGFKWPVPCDVERVADMTPSEISGMMLDKSYFNDVIGTYMKYDVSLAVPPVMENLYSTLYETLTDPVDGHSFVMPHNQTLITVTGRVESVQDALVYSATKKQYWKSIRFSVISNYPSKVDELGNVIARGRSPMPEDVELPIGAVYQLTDDGWYPFAQYENLDVVHF